MAKMVSKKFRLRIGRGSYSLPTLEQVTEAEDSAKGE